MNDLFYARVAHTCDALGDFGPAECGADVADFVICYTLSIPEYMVNGVVDTWLRHPAASRCEHKALIDDEGVFLFAHATLSDFHQKGSRSDRVKYAVKKILKWHYPLSREAAVYELGLGGRLIRWSSKDGDILSEDVGAIPCLD